MSTPLRTIADLRLATRREIADDDEAALFVLAEASGLVCDHARHPEWEEDPGAAPRAARRIALAVAARTFMNPEFEVASSLGPMSSRHHDLYALGLNLSESEKDELEAMRGGGEGGSGLGIMTLAGGVAYDRTLYVRDGQSIYSDLIPYFDTDTSDAGVEPDDVIVP